jgi:VWFA-related protein
MKTCAALLLLASCGVAAQDPVPTIRATASEVQLDIVVRDKHGKPVKNLKASDVQIYEDGVRQDVRSFRFVATREMVRQEVGVDPAQPSPKATAPRPLRAVNLICIVFHNLDPVSRTMAIEAMREFLKNDLQPQTYVGMFLLDDRLKPVYPFSDDRRALLQALNNVFMMRGLDFAQASEAVLTASPNQVTMSTVVDMVAHTSSTTMTVSGGEVAGTVINGAEVNTAAGANVLRGAQAAERRDFSDINGMRETDKMINMINQLGGLPGHKSVLLLTTGLVTTGDPDRFQKILDKANQVDLTVYAMDVSGLTHVSTAQAADLALGRVAAVSRSQTGIDNSMGSLGAAKEKSRQGDTMNDAVRNSDTQASLRALSEGTGGFLIANTNEFRKPFQRIADDLEVHYEASYHPASERYDGRLRTIEVKLARPDLRVESRTGYFALSEGLQPFEIVGLAVLNTKPLPHAFDFRSAAYQFRDSQSALTFELPGSSLLATPHPERQTHALHASLLALVKDASGLVVDKYSIDAPYEVSDTNFKAMQASSVMYTHPVNLPPGHYTVEAAVIDREGGRTSTNLMQFDSPASHKGVGLSSVMLIQRLETVAGPVDASDPLVVQGKRLVPFLASTLAADAKPYVYFAIYPDKTRTEKPKLHVEFQAEGQVFANQSYDLPAPDATGAIPMLIRAAPHAGPCELKIVVSQGTESVSRSLGYTISGSH